MRYFVAKTDPETYSVEQFAAERRTVWDGVRNPQALRAIAQMRPGDRVFVYHSGAAAAIAGVARVASEPRPDPRNPKLTVVDLEFEGRLEPAISLKQVKDSGKFADFALVRQARLSTMAAPDAFASWVWEQAKLRS
jgi:predicted RNA-binding protein with PUA-like domain